MEEVLSLYIVQMARFGWWEKATHIERWQEKAHANKVSKLHCGSWLLPTKWLCCLFPPSKHGFFNHVFPYHPFKLCRSAMGPIQDLYWIGGKKETTCLRVFFWIMMRKSSTCREQARKLYCFFHFPNSFWISNQLPGLSSCQTACTYPSVCLFDFYVFQYFIWASLTWVC